MPTEKLDPVEAAREPDFDFTAAEVLKTLRPASGSSKIEYMGSAQSHFQSEPIIYDAEGKPCPPVSDWELELRKNTEGKPSSIKDRQKPEELPRFLEKKDRYFERSKDLGENMFRLSLDFARLCPEEGEFNDKLMADYVRAIALIKAGGQEPLLTIHHFTMPKFLLETDKNDNIVKGGWEHPDVSKHFRFFVRNITKFLSDEDALRDILRDENFTPAAQDKLLGEGLVKYFISLNEPASTVLFGYLTGMFPPYRRNAILPIKKILERMVEAHDMTRDEIKKKGMLLPGSEEGQVGVAYNWQYFDGIFSNLIHRISNQYITDQFERDGAYSDFLGLQYYFRQTAPLLSKYREDRDYSDMPPSLGDIYPPGILELLGKMNRSYPAKEIFITEVGFADEKDMRRPYWILETVRYIIEAKKRGVPIKGMTLWSLVNNLEWNLGMNGAKFGLFNEKDLNEPLIPSDGNEGIRSWEVWQAATKAITDPTSESLSALQSCYERARDQYEKAKTVEA